MSPFASKLTIFSAFSDSLSLCDDFRFLQFTEQSAFAWLNSNQASISDGDYRTMNSLYVIPLDFLLSQYSNESITENY